MVLCQRRRLLLAWNVNNNHIELILPQLPTFIRLHVLLFHYYYHFYYHHIYFLCVEVVILYRNDTNLSIF